MAYGTINADKLVGSSGGTISPDSGVFRNRIINGAMMIDQRNAGASVTPTATAYTLDRWQAVITQSSKFSVQQNAGSVTPPVGFTNYLGVTSLAATTLGAGDYYLLYQKIEGFNTSDLDFGKSTAKTITVSFWVRSSLTGTFGASIHNSDSSRCYPFNYTISSSNTWTQVSVTIAGDTTGTWLTTNGIGLQLILSLGVGTTYGSGTANAWTSSSFIFQPTGSQSVVGTNGATFYITGVQLEKGSTATSFDYRPYGTELALCQRYYIKYGPFASGHNKIGSGYISSSTNGVIAFAGPSMRASPTVSYASAQISDGSVNATITSVSGANALGCGISVELTGSGGGLTLGRGSVVRLDPPGFVDMSAEL